MRRAGRRSGLAFPPRATSAALALVAAACGSTADPVVTVRGRVDPVGLPAAPVEIEAVRGGDAVSASPIEDDGSFLVALPAGEEVQVALVDRRGATVAWLGTDDARAATLRSCDPGADIDLGPLAARPGTCLQGDACRSALALRTECLRDAAADCGALAPELSRCLDRHRDACIRARLALKACDPDGQDLPGCERERYLAATCEGVPSCEQESLAYWARCGFPCSGLEALVGRVCSRCGTPDLVFGTLPERSGCGGAP